MPSRQVGKDYAKPMHVFTEGDAYLHRGSEELKRKNYSGAFEAYKKAASLLKKEGGKKFQEAQEGIYSAGQHIASVYIGEAGMLELSGKFASAARSYRVAALKYREIDDKASEGEMKKRIEILGPAIRDQINKNIRESEERRRKQAVKKNKGYVRKVLESFRK